MLPAQYRMRRSSDFGATIRYGLQMVRADIVIHTRVVASVCGERADSPKVGLIVAKSVGSAVQRHGVARRLRHVARSMLPELQPGEQMVIRALPSSRYAESARLEHQLRTGLRQSRASARDDRGRSR